MSIRETTSDESKAKLRKVKTVSGAVKAAVYGGNKGGQRMAVQFNNDVRLYGLWEALLYVEGYEREGYYKPGTAVQALEAAIGVEAKGISEDGN